MYMHVGKHQLLRRVAEWTAPSMFGLSLTFLVCTAVVVVVWFDVPNFSENAQLALNPDEAEAEKLRAVIAQHDHGGNWIWSLSVLLMRAIWPLVVLEAIFHWVTRPWEKQYRKYHFFGLLFCIFPPLRMCARSPEMHDRLWLPGLGWRTPNKRLRRRLEKNFSIPMIFIALMILPVLIIEFFLKAQVAQHEWLRLLLHISTGVIWFAFAAEFILMVAVADKKIVYCKRHWVDLAIILLPLCSFLRFLRVMRVQQITKLARVYRLRGTAIKAIQALFVLDSVQRLLSSNTERAINRLQAKLDDVEAEAKQLRRRITKLQKKLEEEQAENEQADQSDPCDHSDPSDLLADPTDQTDRSNPTDLPELQPK